MKSFNRLQSSHDSLGRAHEATCQTLDMLQQIVSVSAQDLGRFSFTCGSLKYLQKGWLHCRACQVEQDGQAQPAELPEGVWQAAWPRLQCALLP